MLQIADIASAKDSTTDTVWYYPTADQRGELLAAAGRDAWLYGVSLRCNGHELRSGERVSSWAMEHFFQRATPFQAREALVAQPLAPGRHCYGGWIRHFSTEYPCSGCTGCRPNSAYAWAIARFIWCAGVAPAHQETALAIAGLEALETIGKHFAALASWFAAFAAMPDKLRHDYQRIRMGHWYEVVGGRGSAKAHKGKVGRCVWRGQDNYGTNRVGLETISGDRIFVAEGQVARTEPNDFQATSAAEIDQAKADHEAEKKAAAAAYAELPKCDAWKGELVVSKTDAQNPIGYVFGYVFWRGEKRGQLRIGARPIGTEPRAAEPLWLDAAACKSLRQLTAEEAHAALVALDVLTQRVIDPHPDFAKAILALSAVAGTPITRVRKARETKATVKTTTRKRRAS
jgi:hypothetical protein